MSFGQNLKRARLNKNYTQKELAKLIGAKHNSISNWENDQNKPDPDTIELICGVLDISANYLLGVNKPNDDISLEALEVAKAYDIATIKTQNIIRITLDLPIKNEDKVKLLPKQQEIPDYIQPIAAHLDGELTDEVKDFIDKF